MKIQTLLGALALTALAAGCSTVSNISKTVSGTVSSTVGKMNRNTASSSSKVNKEKHNISVSTEKASSPLSSSTEKLPQFLGEVPSVNELCSGQWVITDVLGTELHGEDDAPYMAFDRIGRFYAFDGCNYLNGNYVLRNDGILALSNVLSTMRMCDEEYPFQIDGVINGAEKIYVDTKRIGQETYLYFKNSTGRTQLTLRRHNMEFLNGNWQVTAIDGTPVAEDDMTVFFDIPELKLHGNTGCNFVNGTIYIDPNQSNALDISNMAVTRMGCPRVKLETSMLVALENTATAIAGHNIESVILLDKNGKELMTLKRLSNPASDN